MNAAFLLITTAWFAGADPAPTTTTAPKVAATGPVTAVPLGGTGGCCGGAAYGGGYGGCGCEMDCCCKKPSCLERLRARFQRNKCCECCNTCATTSCCNTGCGGHGGCGGGNVGCCGGNVGCCGGNVGCGGGNVGCCGSTHNSSCGCCEPCCCKKPSCLERLRARFHRNNCCDCCGDNCGGCGGCGGGVGAVGGYAAPGVMPGAEPIKVLPKESKPGKKLPSGGKTAVPSQGLDVTPASSSNVLETETKYPFELNRRYETRVGRAADYSWVTGQLSYVHADGGLWVLRYAPLGEEDANGGSVILAGDRRMDSYREGDLVKVHGAILTQKGSIFLGGPRYRVESIELIDRAAR